MHDVQSGSASIPAIGLGTWDLRGAVARDMVSAALGMGYRHIDTAQMYGNEREVGEGMRASGVARDEIFLTTKIWPDRFKPGDLQRSVEESMERLGFPQVDLMLLHWPNPDVPLVQTIEALEDVHARGLTRHIGVSNFTTRLLDEALTIASAPIVTNQIEYHPFLDQSALIDKQGPLGISITAYCPLARGRAFGNEVLKRIGARYGKNEGQVCLRWLVQQPGVIAIPRSAKPEHVRSNAEVFDFELTAEEMNEIAALSGRKDRIVNVAGLAPAWDA